MQTTLKITDQGTSRVLMVALCVACPKRANVNPTKTLVPIEAATFGLSNSYQVSPYPVDNFGILTAYKPPQGERWDESNEICATWSCLGVDANKVPTDPNERLSVSGFADTGTGGTISLSDDQQNSFGVKLLLPGLAKLVDIKGNVDWKSHVTVNLQLGNATKRVLNRIKAYNYMKNTLQPGNPLKDAFDQGQLVILVADLVVDSLDATIKVDKDLNAGADAALSKAAESQQLPVGKDASLSGKLENKGGGSYHLEVKNPVVIAVLPKQQPSAGTLGPPSPSDPWGDWKQVLVPLHRDLQ